MKKFWYIISIIFVIFMVDNVNAASLTVKASSTAVVVGNNVTITVGFSGEADAWEYELSYDANLFSLVSPSSPHILGGILAGNKEVNFVLKARNSGTATFTLKGVSVLDSYAKEIQTSVNSVKVTSRTQAEIQASYSTNAFLSSLSVNGYELSPAFNKNTTSYSLEVENEVDKVIISGAKEDSKASVSGLGEKELTEGINKFNIVVTAEKGNKKTYTIEINRKLLNPIYVKVDDKELSVVRDAEALEVPSYYTKTEIQINEDIVPALKSDITKLTLVGLKDEEGNINLYVYNDVTVTYNLYKQVNSSEFVFIPEIVTDMIDGYETVKEIEINDTLIDSYTNSEDSDFVLLYGMNASTGETAWYKYDLKEKTFQRYFEENIESNSSKDLYFYLTITFGAVLGLTILLLIILIAKNSSIRKKNNKLIEMLKEKRNSNNSKEKISNEVEVKEKKEEINNSLLEEDPIIENNDDSLNETMSDTEFFGSPRRDRLSNDEEKEDLDDGLSQRERHRANKRKLEELEKGKKEELEEEIKIEEIKEEDIKDKKEMEDEDSSASKQINKNVKATKKNKKMKRKGK